MGASIKFNNQPFNPINGTLNIVKEIKICSGNDENVCKRDSQQKAMDGVLNLLAIYRKKQLYIHAKRTGKC